MRSLECLTSPSPPGWPRDTRAPPNRGMWFAHRARDGRRAESPRRDEREGLASFPSPATDGSNVGLLRVPGVPPRYVCALTRRDAKGSGRDRSSVDGERAAASEIPRGVFTLQ